MDNARIHKKNELETICSQNGITLLFLPPYSPYLNPIERCFSKLKSHVKKWLCGNNKRMLATAEMDFGQKGAARSRLLEEAIAFAISKISNSHVQKYLDYSRRYYPLIFQNEPIQFE